MKISICAVADVHCQDIKTPEADILAVAGDLTWRGNIKELTKFRTWLVKQPQRHKVVIAGNHDFCFENKNPDRHFAETMMGGDGIIYLKDQMTVVEGLRIYGSPWQFWFYDWAFNLSRGPALAAKWAQIPENLDLLIVHGPPMGYGDMTSRGERVGCEDLLAAIEAKKPKTAIFGHIHEDTGRWNLKTGTTLYNCSVGPDHAKNNKAGQPVLFELDNGL